MRRKQKKVLLGAAAGFLGGLAGAFVMNEFQAIVADVRKRQQGEKPHSKPSQEDSDDATMKAADQVSQVLLRRGLTKHEKQTLGPVVHYAFGGAMGAFYGGLAVLLPEVSAGFGTAFGAALFAVADETAVPALGLSKAPTEYPLSSHLMALASHLVWGTTTEVVRRIAA